MISVPCISVPCSFPSLPCTLDHPVAALFLCIWCQHCSNNPFPNSALVMLIQLFVNRLLKGEGVSDESVSWYSLPHISTCIYARTAERREHNDFLPKSCQCQCKPLHRGIHRSSSLGRVKELPVKVISSHETKKLFLHLGMSLDLGFKPSSVVWLWAAPGLF